MLEIYLKKFQLRQDAPQGSDLPAWVTNSTTYNSTVPFANQTIRWQSLSKGDAFFLLVDDVQRYAGRSLHYPLKSLNSSIPHFFRLAVCIHLLLNDFLSHCCTVFL